ncbi:hypothetical protein Vadar_004862 [Vaccinium darrowii]|uniref:Uncharacterized protein n=1 Tax=Vaccinium darrowii TaxID=229202 RepID=A0ACB7YSR9_9ERIC|nr:hypothetical protein Vadar_004862 [Vaccinium darrowii]
MDGLFTVFVDNLPSSMDVAWLRQLFSPFGCVKDVFIPSKRSSSFNTKFGFVRFKRREEAASAIEDLNGALIRDFNIVAQFAKYSKGSPLISRKKVDEVMNDFSSSSLHVWHPLSVGNRSKQHVPFNLSYAEALKSASNVSTEGFELKQVAEKSRPTIDARPHGYSWLSRSAVVKLKYPASSECVLKALKCIHCEDVLIRSLGGLFMLLTFEDKAARDNLVANKDIKVWFDMIKPWNGEAASHSRIVWINCRGMPLNAWYSNTFKQIGELWGDFLALKEDSLNEKSFEIGRMMILTDKDSRIDEWINIRVSGKIYEVKVWEEVCEEPFYEESKISTPTDDDSHLHSPTQISENDKNDANDMNETIVYDSLEDDEMEAKSQVKAKANSFGLVEANGGSNEVNSSSFHGGVNCPILSRSYRYRSCE